MTAKKICGYCGQEFEMHLTGFEVGALLTPPHYPGVCTLCPGSHQPARDPDDPRPLGKDQKSQ